MADLRRTGPYLWVTWLTELLAGEHSCEWAGWFRAQHYANSWTPVASSLDLPGWLLAHTAALNEYRNYLEAQQYTVFTENQNAFHLQGQVATLGGKPDLIARQGATGTIVDVKTGKPRASHTIQVMLYMYAVPRALPQHEGVTFDGKIVYQDHEVPVPADSVNETFIQEFGELIRRLSSRTPARKVPSPAECRFCQISSVDCTERLPDLAVEARTVDF